MKHGYKKCAAGAPPSGEAWCLNEGSPLTLYWRFIGLLKTALIIVKRVLHRVNDGQDLCRVLPTAVL